MDELLHLYGSTVDGVPQDNTWEIQTYIHFQDNQGVTVVIKPEHRVEDILTLACKVMDFAAEIYFCIIIDVVLLCFLYVCGI